MARDCADRHRDDIVAPAAAHEVAANDGERRVAVQGRIEASAVPPHHRRDLMSARQQDRHEQRTAEAPGTGDEDPHAIYASTVLQYFPHMVR